jgi:hypothetical protein
MNARVGVLVLAAVLAGGRLHAQADAILGTWRGTSICVKEEWNRACNDEQIVYYVTRAPGRPDSVALDAHKVVNGVEEAMGVITLGPDSTGRTWSGEWSNARYHLLWIFEVRDTVLSGTLRRLPDRRIGRNISARKD